MNLRRSIVPAIALAALAGFAAPALAMDDATPWWVPRLREKDVAAAGTDASKADAAAQAAPAPAKPAPAPAAAANTAAAPASAPAPALPAGSIVVGATVAGAASTPAAPATPPPPPLPGSSLLKTCSRLREGQLGREPNSVAYLNLIEAGKATPAQVNDFAAYLAKRGMVKIALQFQEYAVDLGPEIPTLWQNLGTMQRTAGNLGSAASAFKHAIALNPNDALAHYNLGAVYDADKKYDDAIEEYRRALVLDPGLADPQKNPQVVNNELLLAVKLTIYQNQAGALGLPLLQMQEPAKAAKPAAASDAKPADKK